MQEGVLLTQIVVKEEMLCQNNIMLDKTESISKTLPITIYKT